MALSSLAVDASPSSADGLTYVSSPRLRGASLRQIDEVVLRGVGVTAVQATPDVLEALSRHVERRARGADRAAIVVGGSRGLPSDDPWRELCARVLPAGLRVASLDVIEVAAALVAHAGDAILAVRDDAPTRFGRALLAELQRTLDIAGGAISANATEAAPTVLFLGTHAASASPLGWAYALMPELAQDGVDLWWEGVARTGSPKLAESGVMALDTLEAWWSSASIARLQPGPAPRSSSPLSVSLATLTPAARSLCTRILLSRRSWPLAQIGALGNVAAAEELVRANVLSVDARGVLVGGPIGDITAADDLDPAQSDRAAVAEALDQLPDPWAWARASELHATLVSTTRADEEQAATRAERSASRAITSTADPDARADLWERWARTVATFSPAVGERRLLSGVDLALRSGDVERALAFATDALGLIGDEGQGFPALLALGRVNVARGDVSTAAYWLGKARTAATQLSADASPRSLALVDVELAEVRLMEGDIDAAATIATFVVGCPSTSTEARLQARNVLGKVLLAQRAWARAEAHFAADACEAAIARDVTGALRARLNRSLALLSSGRIDDARAMLVEVLTEGEARGEVRAVAYALTNLASIATLKRSYAEALDLSERAFDVRRRIGDKVTLALLITNLAELKLELGMVAEAEQALAFGRNACGPGMPGSRASHFAITAASIHLAKGRTAEARAEVATAISTAASSPHGARLGECWRLAARIALEDGDLSAARGALDRAADAIEASSSSPASPASPREQAWIALLEASYARAAGRPFADAAAKALARAIDSGDLELLRESHAALHHAARLAGDARAARSHAVAAIAARDQISESLPPHLRQRFLARRDLAALASLETFVTRDGARETSPDSAPVPPSSEGSARLQPDQVPAIRRMTGRTPAMATLVSAIMKVGRTDATVLVQGESGTGKELVAEAIHESSARRAGPLVKVNCSALVETLLLSELFGHERGSFTGAATRRRGRFEVADGGTLFLDEIGDISPRTQVALLRVLQDKTFERVGGVAPLRADVRIVCATHRDLASMVARGEFREDLYYRLRGVVLELPPLRDRITDLPLIAESILAGIAKDRVSSPKRLSPRAIELLCRHTWPGNVRELENVLRAAALFAEGDVIDDQDLHARVGERVRGLAPADEPSLGKSPNGPASSPSEPPSSLVTTRLSSEILWDSGDATDPTGGPVAGGTGLATDDVAMSQTSKIAQLGPAEGGTATEVAYAAIRAGISLSELKRDIERECIARALAETGGNITRAAGLLGMKRPRLSQLVKQYGFGSSSAPPEDGAEDDE